MNLALKIQLILTDITTLKINVYCWYIRLGEASIGGKILKEVIDESFELLLEGDVDICSIMWTGVEVVYGLAGSEKEISTLKKANKGNVDSRGLLSDFLEKPVAKECGRFYSITNEAGGQVFVSTENISKRERSSLAITLRYHKISSNKLIRKIQVQAMFKKHGLFYIYSI